MHTLKEYIRDGRAPIPKNSSISRIMSANKYKNTKPEILLRKELFKHNIRGYRLHWDKVPGRPDIAFPGKKFAIFVNGCFWHRCPYCEPSMPKSHSDFWKEKFAKNIERDKRKLELLSVQGWRTLVLWECQIKEDIDKCLSEISCLLNNLKR